MSKLMKLSTFKNPSPPPSPPNGWFQYLRYAGPKRNFETRIIIGNNFSSSEDGLKMWAVSTAITMLGSYTSSGSWRMLFVLELAGSDRVISCVCDILIFRGRSLVDRSPHGRVSFLRLFHHQGSKHARVWRYLIFFSGTGTLFQYQIFPMLVPVLFLVLYQVPVRVLFSVPNFFGTGSGTFFGTIFFRYRLRYFF